MLQGAMQVRPISLGRLVLTLAAFAAFAAFLWPLCLLPLRLLLYLSPSFAFASTTSSFCGQRLRVRRVVTTSITTMTGLQADVTLVC